VSGAPIGSSELWRYRPSMVILGIILLIIGLLVASLHVLFVIGIILLVVGLVLNLVPIGGSKRRVF